MVTPAAYPWSHLAGLIPSNRVSVEPVSEFPGIGIFGAETNRSKTDLRPNRALAETDHPKEKPANGGLFSSVYKISVRTGMRGGPGRTRTSNQTVMSGRL